MKLFTMRRNPITIIKAAIFVFSLLFFGPMVVNFFSSSSGDEFDIDKEEKRIFRRDTNGKHHEADTTLPPNVVLVQKNEIKPVLLIKDDGNLKIDWHAKPKNLDVQFLQNNDDNDKIDWHEYSKIAADRFRTGPGEQGAAVILSAEEEKQKGKLYSLNGFNGFVSDKISLDRSIKDIRHPECQKLKYSRNLVNASVIIPFHNEHWTTLLRSVHSVLNRSPRHLIHEILLVDDFSSKVHCGKQLDDHLATHYDGRVKVIRAQQREGLIRTRLLGAKAATGHVLIFLDSHVEANVNWLPPLLEPITEDYKTVVCPFIDVIDYETFAYRAQDEGARGAFDWELFYKRLPMLQEDLKTPWKPFKSPVMAGGLFAISAKWFWEMGGYDPGLEIWGGEQYELSFKIWQCHGQMIDAPCSRIGHIYRKFSPISSSGKGNYVSKNYRRVAEVWMDEYAEYIYKRRPGYRSIDPGDVSVQKAIREKLKCKSFKWFMEEVAFDLTGVYPPVEPPHVAEGEIRSAAAPLCIDTRFQAQHRNFGLATCIEDNPDGGGEQKFQLTWHRDIRPQKRNVCFDVSQSILKAPLILYDCHGMRGNQHFKLNPHSSQLYHVISNQCLDCDIESKEIFMNPCDETKLTQIWRIESVNRTEALALWR